MTQPVTKAFQRSHARIRGRKRRSCASWLKRLAHRRVRNAENAFVSRRDWDADVIDAKPVCGPDVD